MWETRMKILSVRRHHRIIRINRLIDWINQSINQLIKTHLYSAISRDYVSCSWQAMKQFRFSLLIKIPTNLFCPVLQKATARLWVQYTENNWASYWATTGLLTVSVCTCWSLLCRWPGRVWHSCILRWRQVCRMHGSDCHDRLWRAECRRTDDFHADLLHVETCQQSTNQYFTHHLIWHYTEMQNTLADTLFKHSYSTYLTPYRQAATLYNCQGNQDHWHGLLTLVPLCATRWVVYLLTSASCSPVN